MIRRFRPPPNPDTSSLSSIWPLRGSPVSAQRRVRPLRRSCPLTSQGASHITKPPSPSASAQPPGLDSPMPALSQPRVTAAGASPTRLVEPPSFLVVCQPASVAASFRRRGPEPPLPASAAPACCCGRGPATASPRANWSAPAAGRILCRAASYSAVSTWTSPRPSAAAPLQPAVDRSEPSPGRVTVDVPLPLLPRAALAAMTRLRRALCL